MRYLISFHPDSLCASSSLLNFIFLLVIPWFSGFSYGKKYKWNSVKAAIFHLVSYPKAFKKSSKSAQNHSALGSTSLNRVVSPHKPPEESGPSFKSVLKPVIRQDSRTLQFPWEHLPISPSSFLWFAGIFFSLSG